MKTNFTYLLTLSIAICSFFSISASPDSIILKKAGTTYCYSTEIVASGNFLISPTSMDIKNKKLKVRFYTADRSIGSYTKDNIVFFDISNLSNAALLSQGYHRRMVYVEVTDSLGKVSLDSSFVTMFGTPVVKLREIEIPVGLNELLLDEMLIIPKVFVGLKKTHSILKASSSKYYIEYRNFPEQAFLKHRSGTLNESGNQSIKICVSDNITGCKMCQDSVIKISPPPVMAPVKDTKVYYHSFAAASLVDFYNFFTVDGSLQKNYPFLRYLGYAKPNEILNPNHYKVESANNQRFRNKISKDSALGKWLVRFYNTKTYTLGHKLRDSIDVEVQILDNSRPKFIISQKQFIVPNTSFTIQATNLLPNAQVSFKVNFKDYTSNPASIILPQMRGSYPIKVFIKDENGAEQVKDLEPMQVYGLNSMDIENKSLDFNGRFELQHSNMQVLQTNVFDLSGKRVLQFSNNVNKRILKQGIYVVHLEVLEMGTAKTYSRKVFIQ